MKKKIKPKTARRWLKRNSCGIAKMKLGIGHSEGSCFGKQMILCQKTLQG